MSILIEESVKKNKILLHSCCAVCASSCVERLINENREVILFYDNPNIYPESERQKRLSYVKMLAKYFSIRLIIGNTSHDFWLNFIKGYEKEEEGGKRCEKCFELNLSLAKEAAVKENIGAFCTSLTVSRYKNSNMIIETGNKMDFFEPYNFKKKGGEMRSIELAKELKIYRQNYCGCEFSLHIRNFI